MYRVPEYECEYVSLVSGYDHFLIYQADQPKPTNVENFQLLSDFGCNFVWKLTLDHKQHKMSLTYQPDQPTPTITYSHSLTH